MLSLNAVSRHLSAPTNDVEQFCTMHQALVSSKGLLLLEKSNGITDEISSLIESLPPNVQEITCKLIKTYWIIGKLHQCLTLYIKDDKMGVQKSSFLCSYFIFHFAIKFWPKTLRSIQAKKQNDAWQRSGISGLLTMGDNWKYFKQPRW